MRERLDLDVISRSRKRRKARRKGSDKTNCLYIQTEK